MKYINRAIITIAFAGMFSLSATAQSVLDPTDPLITYNPSSPPVQPTFGQIGKWVRTKRESWNSDSYKAYIYKGVAFRLKFPKTYNPTAVDGKKYPMMVFFHGLGEADTLTDNEFQLDHGGQFFMNSVDNGTYDGYVMMMQSQGFWGNGHYDLIKELIDYMVVNNKLDPFRVSDNGLSAGGQATWEMFLRYPNYLAAVIPMSSVSISYNNSTTIDEVKFTPFWNIHGGLDGSPAPSTADQVNQSMLAAGANYKDLLYPDLGHDTWTRTWTEPDFWPFQLRAYSSNPWPLFGRTDFCPADVINTTIGLAPGYDAYEWRKDGVLISGATINTLNVTQLGTYDARVRRGSLWSDWSHVPVVIKIKAATVTPTIKVTGLASSVLPGLDGKTSVQLEVPDGYATYQWQQVGNATTLSTTRFLTVSAAGDYKVKIMEKFGCTSDFSSPFTVADANGPNKPDPAISLVATTLSKTSVRLDWSDNPTPQFNETGFEVYDGTQTGGPYVFAGLSGRDVRTFTVNGLNPNTKYFFKVRAVTNAGAAAPSNEASGITQTDTQPPTAPNNLAITGTSRNSISLSWSPSTDDVGVVRYELYVNGQKQYITTGTNFTISGLQYPNTYVIAVKAKDFAGNSSAFSNQVTGEPLLNGLDYKYYVLNTAPSVLPDFNTLPPAFKGTMPNISLTPRTQDFNFGFLWEGYILIPEDGNYTFATNSDDGSKLYLGAKDAIGSPYSFSAVATVNNDGNHGATTAFSSQVFLLKGIYPIAVAYYQGVGGFTIGISWKTPSSGGNFVTIPNSAFSDTTVVNGTPPSKPSNLVATAVSYRRIDLTWTRNSTNESAFEIWRSTSPFTNFSPVGQVLNGVLSYKDSTLNPNTKYYYQVRAINQYGESAFDKVGQGVDYAYYEQASYNALPDFNSLTPIKTGHVNNFGLGMQNRDDNFALKFTGTINIPAQGIYTFYTNSDDGSKLYIDGFDDAHLVVNNDGPHGATEQHGSRNLTPGAHTIYVTYFESVALQSLSVSMYSLNMPKQTIPDSYLGTALTNATTFAAPGLPAQPTNLVATGVSKSSINVSWTDNATNETKYELFRSANNTSNYVLFATLGINANSFTDTDLFPNAVYYYRVRAVGTGNSAFSVADSGKTQDTPPVISQLPASKSAHFDATTSILIGATDADGDALNFTGLNLPSFATLVNNGNRTATLTLSPTSAQQGVYNNVRITVNDPNGGSDFTQFNLTVNGNYDPTIGSISSYTINEGDQIVVPLTATDLNGDNISWTVQNLPNAFTLTPSGNGSTANLSLNPGFGAQGSYVVQVNATDGAGGYAASQFNLKVNDKDPNLKVYIRMRYDATHNIGAPWNTVTTQTSSNFVDDKGNVTGIGLSFPDGNNWGNSGISTGNNSGVYPDPVLQDYYVFGAPWMNQTARAILNGLDPTRKYNLTLLGNSNWNIAADNGNTNYTINGVTQSLYVQNNTQNTVTFANLSPASDGTITISMTKGTGASAGFLNSIVVNSLYNDGTAPAAPANLNANYVFGQGSKLTWLDNAYNETGFEIYRATTSGGTYSLVGTVNVANSQNFTDNTATGNTQYFYKVRATNGTGPSPYSNIVSLLTPDRIPQINPISDIILKNNQSQTVTITTVDDASDHVGLTATGLPPFASFTDNGNGTGTLNVVPNLSSVGNYPGITITAKDNSDSSRSTVFSISIIDKDVTSVYLNFTDGTLAGKPWNNLVNPQYAGTTFTNLKDDNDAASSITVNMQDGSEWVTNTGMRPGNGKEIYPDAVMRTGTIESSTTSKRILISGLSTSRTYNFVFFNSRDDGRVGTTNFTINGKTVSLIANYNINKTVQINGVVPNVSGQVTITVTKPASSEFAFLNSLIIQSYNPATISIVGPTGLRAIDATRTSVKLQWQDRSTNETGFEVWRANDGSSSYSLVATVNPDVTTYTDGGLSANRTYFYSVRAKLSSASFSNYSNVAKASTYAYSVYVNFSDTHNSGMPWNNTAIRPQIGTSWNSLKDETGFPTSLSLTNNSNWSGMYAAGATTGNNSGVYPDNVMFESYGLFPGVNGTLKLTGLNVSMKYNFTFFASSQAVGDVNVLYIVNGKSVMLNASVNTTGTVTMYDVVADENGEANITVAAGTATSQFGLIGALVVQGYTPSANSGSSPASKVSTQPVMEVVTAAVAQEEMAIVAYPNPFTQEFTLGLSSENDDAVEVLIYDLDGRLLYQNKYNRLMKGMNYLKIQAAQRLNPGVYMVKTISQAKNQTRFVKVVKQ
ncbi:MAG: fibronectin type III domain-containing protein [Flavisolibacter sp.]